MARTRITEIDDPSALGRRLREAREARGLSLRQLAFPGCSAPYLSTIEHGKRVPSLQVLQAVADRLGIAVRYLATGDELDPAGLLRDAEVALYMGDQSSAEEMFRTVSNQSWDATSRAFALGGLGLLAVRQGRLGQGIELLEQAWRESGDGFLARANLVESLGRSYATNGAFEAAVALFRAAREHAEARGDAPGTLRFTVLLANTYIDLGDLSHSTDTLADALNDASGLADPLLRARVLWTQSRLHAVEGRQELAAEFAERALSLLRLAEDDHAVALAQQTLAYIELARGNAEKALELLDDAAPVLGRASDPLERAAFKLERARALVSLERLDEAHAEAVDIGPELQAVPTGDGGRYLSLLGDLYQALGRDADALEMYDAAIERLHDHRSPHLVRAYTQKAELLQRLGRHDEALQALTAALKVQAPAPAS